MAITTQKEEEEEEREADKTTTFIQEADQAKSKIEINKCPINL